ncbi:PQQ-binding-like beta-propeller repeat protein [Haloplanus sp. C73]|uniref:outer membrane protein assembly factor BamB family protein n=1 Tax=Haloplanus sp. C73 TaxID=3421641 RepID=UPI003EB99812
MAGYDPQNTGHNPHATPPRQSPSEDWRVQTSETVTSVIAGPDAVYASAEDEIVAVSRNGSERWRESLGGGLYYVAGRLYVSTDDAVVALDADSGDERWRSDVDDFEPSEVYEVAGTVYVTGRESVCGLHADTGERRWRLSTARYPALVASDDRLAVVTNERIRRLAPGEMTTGLVRDSAPTVKETIRTGWRPWTMAPTLADGVLFVPQYGDRLSDSLGAVRKYGLTQTDEYWMSTFTWRGVAAVSVTADTVFAAPYRATTDPPDGSLVALDRETGEERWRYDGAMLGRPAVGDGVVVTGAADPGSPSVCAAANDSQERTCTDGEPPAESGVLHGFDADSGERLWTTTPGHSFGGYPLALAGDHVYYGDADGLHALS